MNLTRRTFGGMIAGIVGLLLGWKPWSVCKIGVHGFKDADGNPIADVEFFDAGRDGNWRKATAKFYSGMGEMRYRPSVSQPGWIDIDWVHIYQATDGGALQGMSQFNPRHYLNGFTEFDDFTSFKSVY